MTDITVKDKARSPDYQRYDEVHIVTVPRYKESELSGDEWRISARADLKKKGKVIRTLGFGDVESAIRYLDGALAFRHEDVADKAEAPDLSYFCDQEGCSNVATVKYEKLADYDSHGHQSKVFQFSRFRTFCDEHLTRGDCALDDADLNYTPVQFVELSQ